MTSLRKYLVVGVGLIAVVAMVSADVMAQRGRGGGGGGGGGRSAGHRSPSASRGSGNGPAMSRPQGQSGARSGANQGGASGAGANRAGANRQAGSRSAGGNKNYQRPGGSSGTRADRPSSQRPSAGGRPQQGAGSRQRPGGGATSDQLSDFLGTSPSQRPGGGDRLGSGDRRPELSDRERPNVGDRNTIGDRDRRQIGDQDPNRVADNNRNNIGDRGRTDIDNRQVGSRDINIGEVNVGNQVSFSQNRRAWVDNRHATGNQVRANAGNRYANAYRTADFRRGAVGGYGYHSGWVNRRVYYGWRAPTTAALGAFCGASLANARPVYYGYGSGGNVYYEDNTVYIDGQPAGTAEQYAQQALDYVAAAPPPEQIQQDEWLPLGVFVLTPEGVDDSTTMLELAINKQGVLAGTYYNESTGASRPLKGTMDQQSQRAVVGFADGSNTDVALEMGVFNLTQEEAPALLHHGTEESTPVLLVRLPAPEDGSTK